MGYSLESICKFIQKAQKYPKVCTLGYFSMPPPRLERGLLASEANALSTELWGQCGAFYHEGARLGIIGFLPGIEASAGLYLPG